MSHSNSDTGQIILNNATVLDVVKGELLPNHRVIVKGSNIEQVESTAAQLTFAETDTVIDVGGKTVMPGLCDAHVHVTAWTADVSQIMRSSPFYTAARSAEIMEAMLMRGFTTVRDVGGTGVNIALRKAIEAGQVVGPRVYTSGKSLAVTGGHADPTLNYALSYARQNDGGPPGSRAGAHPG